MRVGKVRYVEVQLVVESSSWKQTHKDGCDVCGSSRAEIARAREVGLAALLYTCFGPDTFTCQIP